MTHKGLLLAIALVISAPAAHAEGPYERIEEACFETLKSDYPKPAKAKAVCGCVRKNYEAKDLNEAELDLMVRSHEQDPKAEEELQADKYEDLVLFDYDVSEGCLKKSSYRHP